MYAMCANFSQLRTRNSQNFTSWPTGWQILANILPHFLRTIYQLNCQPNCRHLGQYIYSTAVQQQPALAWSSRIERKYAYIFDYIKIYCFDKLFMQYFIECFKATDTPNDINIFNRPLNIIFIGFHIIICVYLYASTIHYIRYRLLMHEYSPHYYWFKDVWFRWIQFQQMQSYILIIIIDIKCCNLWIYLIELCNRWFGY